MAETFFVRSPRGLGYYFTTKEGQKVNWTESIADPELLIIGVEREDGKLDAVFKARSIITSPTRYQFRTEEQHERDEAWRTYFNWRGYAYVP